MATDNSLHNNPQGGGITRTADKSSGFSPLDDQIDPQEYARLLDLYDSSFRNIAEGEVVKGTVLKVTASEVIVDVAGVLLVLIAVRCVQSRAFVWAALTLAMAAGVKPFAALLLPALLVQASRAGWRPLARSAAVAVATLSLVYVPAMLYQSGYRGWYETAHTYARHWEANGSLYEWYKSAFGAGEPGDVGHAMVQAKSDARRLAAVPDVHALCPA
jgi:hypothetical protein